VVYIAFNWAQHYISIYLHFNGHFPGEPWLASAYLIEAKDDGGGGDNWTTGDVQSSSQIITTNKPTSSFFYRPVALPVAQPTVSKH